MTTLFELEYWLHSRNGYEIFDDARPWRGAFGPWDCSLDQRTLTARHGTGFDSVEAARASLDPTLKSWETAAFLRDQYEIEFIYVSPGLDSSTGAPGQQARGDRAIDLTHIVRRLNHDYPEPDRTFTVTPLVDELMMSIAAFQAGHLSLPAAVDNLLRAMAAHGSCQISALPDMYRIEPQVITKLVELVDPSTRQPAAPSGAFRGPEWQFMQEALRLMTLQAGRVTAPPDAGRTLQMTDFRSLRWLVPSA